MLLRAIVYATLCFLVAPILIIVLFSFNESQSLSFPVTGLSLRWYAQVFQDAQIGAALLKSLNVAFWTALITLVLGTGASLAWLRITRRQRMALEVLSLTPIALPGLFLGVALLVMFSQAGIKLSTITIILSHVLLTLPLLIVSMKARLALFDSSLEEASRDLGASILQTFARVTLPIIAPTLFACVILSFAVSFDEFVVTSFVAGTETTLPMYIWSMMRRTVTPLINAISTLALLFSILILVTAWLVGHLKRASAVADRTTP
ncbi:ABC transporter permease [Pseudomonas sp. MOB-449]|nr:ABC transporter permease [Pseudomonas sp. MOB-449]